MVWNAFRVRFVQACGRSVWVAGNSASHIPGMLGQMYCMDAMQAMKINAKINGINHKLSAPPFAWMKKPWIVIGTQSPSYLKTCVF